MTKDDLRKLADLDGLYVGLLDVDDYTLFLKAVHSGLACRWYEGVGGFLGLAKVKVGTK